MTVKGEDIQRQVAFQEKQPRARSRGTSSRANTRSTPWRSDDSEVVPLLGPFQAYLAFSLNDDDGHGSGRPAVFGW